MILKEIEKLSAHSTLVIDETTSKQYILKPSIPLDICEQAYAANELICHNLIKLIFSKGIQGKIANVISYIPPRAIDQSWYHPCVLIEHLGEHSRVATDDLLTNHHHIKIPTWLYWFDRWVGRIDSNGDSNLLLLKSSNELVPVDFEMTFPWAGLVYPYIKNIDDFDINCHTIIEQNKNENAKQIIKSLSNKEIWDAIFNNVPKTLIPTSTLIAYWSGLCMRQKLL